MRSMFRSAMHAVNDTRNTSRHYLLARISLREWHNTVTACIQWRVTPPEKRNHRPPNRWTSRPDQFVTTNCLPRNI